MKLKLRGMEIWGKSVAVVLTQIGRGKEGTDATNLQH